MSLPGQAPYDALINSASTQYGVPAGLIAAQLFTESSFNPSALSKTGARGIAQFEPGTAKQYGVDVTSPASSIAGEAHYMRDLYDKTGSWDAALQAYSGDTAGYAAKIDALWTGNHATPTATGAPTTAPATGAGAGAGVTAGLTDWLDSTALRVGAICFGGLLLLLGLHKMATH